MLYRLCILLFLCLSALVHAQDTFSIVAVDSLTGEIGSAGATCLARSPGNPIGALIISDVIPGIGAIHTQAYWTPENQKMAHKLMRSGLGPQQILDSMQLVDVDDTPETRQYGVVDFVTGHPRSAAYTGTECDDYKSHIVGANYAIQGNILKGQFILDSIEARFLREPGTLGDKLMAALQGANVPGADTRCLDSGKSSASSFIRVAKPTDDSAHLYLQIIVTKTAVNVDPIDSLQTLYTAWRQSGSVAKQYSNNAYDVRFESGELVCQNKTERTYGPLTIEVYDLAGRMVLQKQVRGETFRVAIDPAVRVCFVRLQDGEAVVYAGRIATF